MRGVRIELGEVIAALAQHPGVQANTVIAKMDPRGQNQLVAYVVPRKETKIDVSALRSYMSESLMPAMVPSTFVTLERLPLLPTGKVDRRQLPEPEQIQPELEETFVPPRNEIEERLAEIWCQVLDIEWIGIHDNFFELGGHSLMAFQIISRVQSQMYVDLPLVTLFESPTIKELAEAIVSTWSEILDKDELTRLLEEMKWHSEK